MKNTHTMGKIKSRINTIIGFLKKAPKSGRTYTDMLKFIVQKELGVCYDRDIDRGMISHCMPKLRSMTKNINGRYIIVT